MMMSFSGLPCPLSANFLRSGTTRDSNPVVQRPLHLHTGCPTSWLYKFKSLDAWQVGLLVDLRRWCPERKNIKRKIIDETYFVAVNAAFKTFHSVHCSAIFACIRVPYTTCTKKASAMRHEVLPNNTKLKTSCSLCPSRSGHICRCPSNTLRASGACRGCEARGRPGAHPAEGRCSTTFRGPRR